MSELINRQSHRMERLPLLLLTLLAYGRVCWRLDANDLWWDESLTLQRAEAGWGTLFRGTLSMYDGFSAVHTTDQHPFFFFAIEGIFVRLAGISEFVLRYPSALAATLLVPVVWVLARYFERRTILPRTTALWAAGFAALHPFFLWFGQEARPYALWAVLSLLALYLLLRATEPPMRRSWLMSYAIVTGMAIATHYYAILWLPLHALHLYGRLSRQNRRLALAILLTFLAIGAAIGGLAAWQIFRQGGGGNFPDISLQILIPDLVNAFSLGLSVTLDDWVHWLGWLFAGLALLGALWGVRTWRTILDGGWLLPLSLLIPISLILLASLVQPAYMNARHLSLLGGSVIILVGGGLALLWQRQRWLPALPALVMAAGLGYSTLNYFTEPAFGKDDYTAMGRHLQKHLLPNDVVLISPAFSWRIFDYYLPLPEIAAAQQQGVHVAYYGAPLLNVEWPENERFFRKLQQEYRRIWLARSGTHPYLDPEGKVPDWLRENSVMRLQEEKFFSPTSFLDLELFLTQPPVYEGLEPPAQQRVDLLYSNQIRLVGYDIERPLQPGSALPITLYWQVNEKPAVRYKYILQLVLIGADGATDRLDAGEVVTQTEIEPYFGQIPTTVWDPGKTIIEYTSLPPVTLDPALASRYRLTLQMYAAETLEKSLVAAAAGADIVGDGQQARMPFTMP